MRNSLTAISALATMAIAGTAHAEGEGWQLHGFGDVSLKSDYVTPRGLVVVDDGATVQVLNGLVAVSPHGFAIHAGTWVDLNPGYNKAENTTAINEYDFFIGISGQIAPRLEAGVEYVQFVSGQPSFAFKDERNIEFSLKYKDGAKDSVFTVNPYAKLFWAVDGDSTVVLGKKGDTFDVELGAVPTYKTGDLTLSAPTWLTVGPKTYWGKKGDAIDDSNFGVISTGLKASLPLKFFKGGAGASVYGFAQYYHLFNDNLEVSRFILTRSTGRDKLTFGAGMSFGF